MHEEEGIEYTEPSGRRLTLDAYWQSQQKDKKVILAVEFPTDLSVPKVDQQRKQETSERLDIFDKASIQIQFSSTERDEIRDRVSRGLKQLKITHTTTRPQTVTDGRASKMGKTSTTDDLQEFLVQPR